MIDHRYPPNCTYHPLTPDPVLSVIIVNWNTRDHLALCLESLRAGAPPYNFEVIVVDNCSADGSVEFVRREWPSVVLIANDRNKGFAGGVNDGLRTAKGTYLVVMNPDIQVHPRCLERLVEFAGAHPEAGAVMPAMYGADGRRQRDYVRLIPGLGQVVFFHTILEPAARRFPFLVRRFLEAYIPPGRDIAEVGQIPGAILLTRGEVVGRVGLMDEGFRLFYEDVDWSLRMKREGLKLLLTSNASVTHAGGGSFRGDFPVWQTGRFVLSLMRFFDCHSSPVTSLAVKIILLANSAGVVLVRSAGLALFGGGPSAKRSFSRARHLHVLKLFYLVYVQKSDPGLFYGPGLGPVR